MSNSADNPKGNPPDSDQTARNRHPTGARNLLKTQAWRLMACKHRTSPVSILRREAGGIAAGIRRGPGLVARDGAFGHDDTHQVTGRNAGAGTNEYHCSGCGRYFNTAEELSAHEPECSDGEGGH